MMPIPVPEAVTIFMEQPEEMEERWLPIMQILPVKLLYVAEMPGIT